MKKETADLVDLQELFELVGPRIFLDDFDVSGFIASIKNEDGVLVPARFDFSSYVPSETAIWITENSSELNQIDSYYDGISAAEKGFFDLFKVTAAPTSSGEGEAFSAVSDEGETLKVFGDFSNVSVGDKLFSSQSLGSFGGTIEYDGDGQVYYKEFVSEKMPLDKSILFIPPREFYSGNTYVQFNDMDSEDPYELNIRTFGGDDVIQFKYLFDTAFIDGGDGNDLVVVEAGGGSDGNLRVFGDFVLGNGIDDDRSHILFDIEKLQVFEGTSGRNLKTYNLENLGPPLDSSYITFFEDNYTRDESIFSVPQSWSQNHFAIPATLAKHSPSSVTDFTFISKNFEDISGDDAKENRRSFELKGSFSYSGSDGLDTSGGLVELQELSGTTLRVDEYFGEFNISTERYYSSMYSEWLFQNKFLKNGEWTQEAYHGDDALISLNGIANGGFDISADDGPEFYTSYNDYIYGHAGDDYIFGGVGDDFIDGGQGNDVAIFLGTSADYTITDNKDGTYSVSDHAEDYWLREGTDTLVNIESLSFSDRDVALGNASVISTIIPTVSLPSISSIRSDVSAKLESLKAELSNAPTLPSLMDATSSDLSGPSWTTSSTDTDTADSGIVADTVSFVSSAANEKFTAATGKVKMKMDMRKEDFSISKVGDSGEWSITGTDIGTDTLSGFKRLEFEDGVLALDTDPGDTAGQAYRLYQAAFARTPDMPGVAYHMNDMESNGLSVVQIARNFIASPEFKTQYGEDPTEDEYINLLYQNVLGRTPGQFEIDYYKERFESGTTDWNTTLVFFAESPENVSLVAPQIEDGIWMPF